MAEQTNSFEHILMEFDKLSIRELIARLNIGQLWAVLGITAGLLVGSFAFGYKVSSLINQAKLDAKDVEIASKDTVISSQGSELSKANDALGELRTKERFLSLFLRYEQADDFDEKGGVRDALDDYIQRFVEAADKAETSVRIGKGSGTQTTVTFSDGSVWTVPPDFRAATDN